MKRPLTILVIFFLISIILISILYGWSLRINHGNNSFRRLFPPHILSKETIMDLHVNSYYIAGATPHHIYLGNPTTPLQLLTIPYDFSNPQTIVLPIKGSINLRTPQFIVDSPYYFLLDGRAPLLMTGELY
ncbi:MAG: hypothetical protein ACJ748_04730, partial [Flavisolibacter sp.]